MLKLFRNILIADDDADDIDLFKEAVKDVCPDIKIVVAKDGLEAMRLLHKNESTDLVVST